jgi:hypothetical protein
MLDCRNNGDPLQLTFVKVVIGALFSPLAMILSVLSVLHDSFTCPMHNATRLGCAIARFYSLREIYLAVFN